MSSISNNPNNNSKVNFYIWKGAGRGFGHVATECVREDGTKTYHSFYPKGTATLWSGLTTWMHPAHVVTSYEMDSADENPNKIITFPVNDETAKKVEECIKNSSNAVELQQKKYCLTPNTPLILFACKFLAFPMSTLTTDPEEGLQQHLSSAPIHEDDEMTWQGINEVKAAHCTTEAEDIAKILMEVPERKRPWSHSPSSFSKYLEQAPNAQITTMQRKPIKKDGLDDDLCPAP